MKGLGRKGVCGLKKRGVYEVRGRDDGERSRDRKEFIPPDIHGLSVNIYHLVKQLLKTDKRGIGGYLVTSPECFSTSLAIS